MSDSPPGKSGLKYRADIDGLRAVAVLSVMAFHVGLSQVSGGYVGVDVFFVISGYLISSIVFAEIAQSRFSVVGFYERRIRRIFPALFATLAICAIFAGIYLLPSELVAFAKSMLAATASFSNFYFWRHSGYFDSPFSQPLLHTWSLAVEEQFYITFPLFLVVVRKFFPQRLKVAVVVLFFASLLASAIVVSHNRETAFYMPYTRAWELLLGTILSLKMFPHPQSAWLRNFATLAGMGMIAYAVFTYTQETLFPGFSALAPCVGSALIIWAGEGGSSLVGSVLSCRPMVFVGLISYSLYLWHWPLVILRHMGLLVGIGSFTLLGHPSLLSPHRFDIVVVVAISFVLAILTWWFVERPFRRGPLRLSGRPLFALAGFALFFLMAVSAWTVFAEGFKGRFPALAVQVASTGETMVGATHRDGMDGFHSLRTGTCFVTTDYHFEDYNYNACLHQVSGKKNYLLLGDSHSDMLWPALAASLPGANVMQASTAACEPELHPSGSLDCRKMMEFILNSYLPAHPVERVFIVGRWEEKHLRGLTQLIGWTHQHQVPVTVFGPVPEYDGPLPRLLAYSIAWHEPNLASQHRVAGLGSLDAEMQSLADNVWHVPYVSLYREICAAQECAEYADGAHTVPMSGDTNHLTGMGASLVVGHLVEKGELP